MCKKSKNISRMMAIWTRVLIWKTRMKLIWRVTSRRKRMRSKRRDSLTLSKWTLGYVETFVSNI